MFEEIYKILRLIIQNTSLQAKRSEYFWEKIPKPNVAAILYSNPQAVYYLNGKNIENVKFEAETDEFKNEKINSALSHNTEIDVTAIAQSLVRQAISEIARQYPPISRVLFQFAIHPSKECPTMEVGFNKEDGKFHMFYSPRFTCFFAIKSLLSKIYEEYPNDSKIEKFFISANLIAPIKFLLLHETMHVVKAHQSKMKGEHIVTDLENIIQDSQINTQLLSMLGNEVPMNLRKEGIDEGIFISYSTSVLEMKKYLNENKEGDPNYHPVTSLICSSLVEFIEKMIKTGDTEKQISYVYINIRNMFKGYTPDQVIYGMEVFEALVCFSKITQKVIDLPDIIKRALLELQKQSAKSSKLKVGDPAILFNKVPIPVRIEEIVKPKKTTIAKLVDLDDGKMGNTSQFFKDQVPIIFLYRPILKVFELGSIVKLYSGETVRIQSRTMDPSGDWQDSDILNIQYSAQDIFSPENIIPIKGCYVSKVIIGKQNIFEGDKVLILATGQEGVVISVMFKLNIYEINISVSGVMIVERHGIQEIKKITEKIKTFEVGDYVYIDKEKKAGCVIDPLPVEPNGLYKVQIIPDEVWNALVKSSKDETIHDADEGFEVGEFYAGELTFLPLQSKKQSSESEESQSGEGKEGSSSEEETEETEDNSGEPKTEKASESKDKEGKTEKETSDEPDVAEKSEVEKQDKPNDKDNNETKNKEPETEAVEKAKEDTESTDQKDNPPEDKIEAKEPSKQPEVSGIPTEESVDEKFGEDDLEEGGGSDASEKEMGTSEENEEVGDVDDEVDSEDNEGDSEEDEPGKGTSARDLQELSSELESLLEEEFEDAIKQEVENEIEQKQIQKDQNQGTGESSDVIPDKTFSPDLLGNIDIPSEVSEAIDKNVRVSNVEDIPWRVVLARRITDVTGVRVYNDDQIPSRRIVGVFEEEQEIPHFKSIGIMFDTSGSMSIMQSMKSLRIIQDFFKDPIFKECVIWIGHYTTELHAHGKLRQFQRERFMNMCKEGFNESGGTDFEKSLSSMLKVARPLPDFILNFTDGEYNLQKYKNDTKLRKALLRTITCIVGDTSYKNNGAYRDSDARMKKNFILGAKQT